MGTAGGCAGLGILALCAALLMYLLCAAGLTEVNEGMTYDEFMALDEEQRRAAYIAPETVRDLEAERDSFKTENDQLKTTSAAAAEELKKTKELNFTLARKVNVQPTKSAEEYLNEAFK